MPADVGLTGARGVLGRRIVSELEKRGHAVDAYPGDIRDRETVERWVRDGAFRTVIHGAAFVPVRLVEADPGRAVAVNAGGSATVAGICQANDRRLVALSTSHVYAPQPRPLAESDVVGPSSLYGLSKLQGEEWVRRLAPESLIVRIFSYFDDAQPDEFVVPALYRRIAAAAEGASLEVFGLTSVRDLVSARWLARAIVDLALGETAGIVNLGGGGGVTIRAVAESLARLSKRDDVAFVPADSAPSSMLVADVALLRSVAPGLAAFDLDQALEEFVDARSR